MNTCQVWLRPLGDFCRVRVDTLENAKWLLSRLSQSFVFKTFEPFVETEGNTACSFRVPYDPPLTRSKLESLLRAIPEVRVMSEPE